MNTLKDAAGVCPLELSERLNEICLDDNTEPQDVRRPKSIPYEQIAEDMFKKAQKNGRDFQKDIFDLILVFISYGNNINKAIDKWVGSEEKKKNLVTMTKMYSFKNNCPFYEPSPTLSRIAAAFPHVTLVFTDMMRNKPTGPKPYMWVRDADLGTRVHDHFKMSYFPGLIDLDGFSVKAQVGLLLHNLCHAKAIVKSSNEEKGISTAFIASCQISAGIVERRMAPLQARKLFTKCIEDLNVDSETLCKVWNTVVGENYISIVSVNLLTHFHEKVLRAQPLNQQKWNQLLDTENSKN